MDQICEKLKEEGFPVLSFSSPLKKARGIPVKSTVSSLVLFLQTLHQLYTSKKEKEKKISREQKKSNALLEFVTETSGYSYKR